MDPTAPVPDYLIAVRIEHGFAIAEVRATGDADITVAMDDLHRHTVAELGRFTWPRGYTVIETRWAEVETINGRVEQMTAMARLFERNDGEWISIREAVDQDRRDLAELRFQRDLEEGGLL